MEAGLRSFDMTMPEEINRKLTDAICDLLFVTEESGVRNLRAEGVPEEKIHMVGNVMIDNLMNSLARIDDGEFVPSESLRAFCEVAGTPCSPCTGRRTWTGSETLEPIWGALSEVARRIPILFPVHPRTRAKIDAFGLNGTGITMIEPVGPPGDAVRGSQRSACPDRLRRAPGGNDGPRRALHHHPGEHGTAGYRRHRYE